MSTERFSDINSKPDKRRSDWLHLESVCSQWVVSPLPIKIKTHMEASVCDNTFGTDVDELFFEHKRKNIVLLQSVFIKTYLVHYIE